ncbi:hypothetical protein [Sphingopyxis sp.]|jgi:hypothetical protein|uniref:hypothetical protein n=1 Tax=Sphingopyxis sp. TaxID=1908224 RepID=UPI003F6E4C86
MIEADPLAELPRPVAVVAHDAGAANIIIAWIARAGKAADFRIVLAGPAATLWQRRFGMWAPDMSLEAALDGAASVLSGTGWAGDLEHRARVLATEAGLRSVAVLDHWVNYPMRFERAGRRQLPGEFWVTDPHAARIARADFPGVPVAEKPNYYLAEQVAAAGPQPLDGPVLFVAEPARSDWGRDQAGEFQALDYFAAERDRLGIRSDMPLVIRPHPSDSAGKYDGWIDAHPGASLDMSPDLAMAIRGSAWVAGMNSFAMVVALAAGRRVICSLPPWAPACVLPHRGIIHLKELTAP